MLKLTQKTYTNNDGVSYAYVETTLNIGDYSYRVQFDEHTKKRFNNYARKEGFKVGKIAEGETIREFSKEVY